MAHSAAIELDYKVEGDEETLAMDISEAIRLWPRAESTWNIDGEWDLVIRGTEEDFAEVHRLLVLAGFVIDETGEFEIYTRKDSVMEPMIDVWELQCEALEADLLFDNYEELLSCLNTEMELTEDEEPLSFTVVRSQMTRSEYDGMPEVEP